MYVYTHTHICELNFDVILNHLLGIPEVTVLIFFVATGRYIGLYILPIAF